MSTALKPKTSKNREKPEKTENTKKTDVAPDSEKKKRKASKEAKSVMPSSHIVKIVKDAAVFNKCRLSCKSAEVIKDLLDRVYALYESRLVDIMTETDRKRVMMSDFYTANMLINEHDMHKDIVNLVSGNYGRYKATKAAKESKPKKAKAETAKV
jgi:hypothetical protein